MHAPPASSDDACCLMLIADVGSMHCAACMAPLDPRRHVHSNLNSGSPMRSRLRAGCLASHGLTWPPCVPQVTCIIPAYLNNEIGILDETLTAHAACEYRGPMTVMLMYNKKPGSGPKFREAERELVARWNGYSVRNLRRAAACIWPSLREVSAHCHCRAAASWIAAAPDAGLSPPSAGRAWSYVPVHWSAYRILTRLRPSCQVQSCVLTSLDHRCCRCMLAGSRWSRTPAAGRRRRT